MANLPLPQGGLASFSQGFHMTDNLMDQILNRKKVAQQNEQFKAQQAQLERHFQAQLGLSKAAAGRAAQAAMDAHAKALREADPTNEAKQYLALENFIKNRGNPGATGGYKPEMIPGNEPAEQMPAQHRMPTEEAGQGQGMLNQEGLSQLQSDEINRQQQAQQAEQMGQESPQEPMPQQSNQPQNIGGPNLELMKAHPMLRGFYKKHFGYDPLAAIPEQPEEKRRHEEESKAIQEQNKLDINRKEALTKEIPEADRLLKDIKKARETIKKHPDLFGPGVGGLSFLGGPSQRKRELKTKEEREAWGQIEDLFGTLVGKKAQEYSHKGLKVSFDLASTTKPGFDEWPEIVDAKLGKAQDALEEGQNIEKKWYQQHGGKVEAWNEKDTIVINPSGKKFKTTKANAAHLPAGWRHG